MRIPLGHRDILKFALYFFVFSTLIFYAVPVFSPIQGIKETFYDSSSIKNKEELPADFLLLSAHSGSVFENASTNETSSKTSAIDSSGITVVSDVSEGEAPATVSPQKTLPKLTFRFKPDTIQIDSKFSKHLEDNLSASVFADKIPPLSIIIDSNMSEPRGKLSGKELSISPNIKTDSEFIKVLVHEMGHVIDIHYLVESRFQKDPSEEFYDISWLDYEHKKKGATLGDFVSGYALSNKYEDFAESFAFFVFHNSDFVRLAEANTVLQEKYDFFANRVFQNAEFSGTSFETDAISAYNWDITKIGIDTKKYLFYLK